MMRTTAIMSALVLSAVFNPQQARAEFDMLRDHAESVDLEAACGPIPQIDSELLMAAFEANLPISEFIDPTLQALRACDARHRTLKAELKEQAGGRFSEQTNPAILAQWRHSVDISLALSYYMTELSGLSMRDSYTHLMGEPSVKDCMASVPPLDREALKAGVQVSDDIEPLLNATRTKLQECSKLAAQTADRRYEALVQTAEAMGHGDSVTEKAEQAWSNALLQSFVIDEALSELAFVEISYGLSQLQN
ncbi:hypothetical protein HN358_03710 [Candidatus Uhrbacteria bacterium]|nr:hypothetical protein [Candidatus Uhrbacteria bacterium]MBT7717241.1 hypothetical protein [Candidatus Uhrbacteria bacterium]